jgi:hypothetical protein
MREGSLHFNECFKYVPGLVDQEAIQKFLKRDTVPSARRERRRMDVDLPIRYSDDGLCEVVVCQPNEGTAIYRIITRRADLGESLRRLYAATPWPDRRAAH